MKLKNERQLESGDFLYDADFTQEEFEHLKDHACKLIKEEKIPAKLLDQVINEAFVDIVKGFIDEEREKLNGKDRASKTD